MIEWSRFLVSVLVLHSIAEASVQLLANDLQTCTELCTGCGGVATFENERCECNISDGNQEGVKCLAHIKKQLEDLELPLPDDATEEERSTRCALRSRRLKTHDADRVVRYFITGGPVVGHSHFVATSNPVHNTESDSRQANIPANIVGAKNPTSDTFSASVTEQKPNIPNFYNPIIGTIHTPVYMMPPMPVTTNLYPQFSNGAYSPVVAPINLTPRYHMPQSNSLVGSILPPHLHPLTSVSQAIQRTANIPIQGLVGAQSVLNNLITHGLTYAPPIHYYDNARYNKDAEVTSSSATDNTYLTERSKPKYKNSQTAESQSTNAPEDAIVGDILNIGQYSGKQKSVEEHTQEQGTLSYLSQQYVPHQSPLLSLLNPHTHGYILQLVPHSTHFLPSNTIGPPHLPTQPYYPPHNIPKNSDANSEVNVKQTKDIDNHCDPEANGIQGKQNEENSKNHKTEKTSPGISRNISKKSIKQNKSDKSSFKKPREAEYDVSVEEIENTEVRI